MFIVVSYDIADDSRRNNVAKTLEDYATRVQYSVFEGNLNSQILEKMAEELTQKIDPGEDNIRIYCLCGRCSKQIYVYGNGKVMEDEDIYVV